MKTVKRLCRRTTVLLLVLILLAGMPMTVFAEGNANSYSDVPFYSWYYDAVDYLSALGVMQGVGNGKFAPNQKLTRAMTVTVLYRIAGSPDVAEAENPFEDVPAGSWYETPVKWAVASGVTMGTSEISFSPNTSITREQLACFVYRFAKSIHADFLTDGVSVDYSEAIIRECLLEEGTSPYAFEAMVCMVMEGIIQGDGINFYPKDRATRAETAVVFRRVAGYLTTFPKVKLILGEDCLEKSFEDETACTDVPNANYLRIIWGKLNKQNWSETDPVDFQVYYRLWYWGTEYQFAKTEKESQVVKVILPDGTVHMMKPKHSYDITFIYRYIGNALEP